MVVDTSVWIRHLTGDPPDLAEIATEFLATARRPVLTDVVVGECVYVLEKYYGLERWRVAELMRSALDYADPFFGADGRTVTRCLEIYERTRLAFADAYLLAYAEYGNQGPVVTFDKEIGKRAESVGVRVLARG